MGPGSDGSFGFFLVIAPPPVGGGLARLFGSLSNRIKDLDEKLRRSLVTQKFVDKVEQEKCSKNKKGKKAKKKKT